MSSSSLEQATLAALAAAEAGDLDTLHRALAERKAALDRGGTPSAGVFAAGELTVKLLRVLIREIRFEDARLRHLANAYAGEEPSCIDLRG
jgi:hypothetical protein